MAGGGDAKVAAKTVLEEFKKKGKTDNTIEATIKKIYELDDDPLMQINDEYLIFANKNSDGTYTTLSGSQGRFEIEGNRVYSLNKSNAQVKKANVGSNIKVSGEDKETFIKSIRAYTH